MSVAVLSIFLQQVPLGILERVPRARRRPHWLTGNVLVDGRLLGTNLRGSDDDGAGAGASGANHVDERRHQRKRGLLEVGLCDVRDTGCGQAGRWGSRMHTELCSQ